MSKVAALAAICVAMFPCGCDSHPQIIPMVHYIAAAVMFSILAVFLLFLLSQGMEKKLGLRHVRGQFYTGLVE